MNKMFNSGKGILISGVLALLTACVSALPRNEYESLHASINQVHDAAIFGEDRPYFMAELSSPDFKRWFVGKYCQASAEGTPLGDRCTDLFKKAITSTLLTKYFASDRRGIEAKCGAEPLVCMEPDLLEHVIRDSHNRQIEVSRAKKLAGLASWQSGKLSDADLRGLLGLSEAAPLLSYAKTP